MSAGKPLFTFGERLGLFLSVEASSLSAASVIFLLLFVAYNTQKKYRSRKAALDLNKDSDAKLAPESDAADSVLFLNLMFAEVVQSVGGLLNIKWIIDAAITEGPTCTAQGITKQAGEVAVALTSLAIALHTFCALVMRWQVPHIVFPIVVAFIWIFIALMIGISVATHKGQDYYGDTDFWCWIRPEYKAQQIALDYLWMWVAAFLMIIIYAFLALVFFGTISVEKGKVSLHCGQQRKEKHPTDDDDDEEVETDKQVAMQMLFYPAIYILCVFPIAVVRWLAFSGHDVPSAGTFFGSILFSSSGIFNVILYTVTRPKLFSDKDDVSESQVNATPPAASPMSDHKRLSMRSPRSLGYLPSHGMGRLPDDDMGRLPDNNLGRLPDNMGHLPDTDDRGHLPYRDEMDEYEGSTREASYSVQNPPRV